MGASLWAVGCGHRRRWLSTRLDGLGARAWRHRRRPLLGAAVQPAPVVARGVHHPQPKVALANRTLLFPHSLLSLAQTESACAGKTVGVCPVNCPTLDAQWRVVSVRYAAPPAGRLVPVARP